MKTFAMTGLSLALGIILPILAASEPRAAPITSNTALAVSKGEILLRQQVIGVHAGKDPAKLNREFNAVTSVSVLVYGATPKLALFGILPYANRTLNTPLGTRRAQGFGDARVFARYTLLQNDSAGQTFRISPFAGVELPTGKNDETDAIGLLPVPVQPGSGSVDFFGGLVATYATTQWQVDASSSYQINREAGNIERGDVFKADLSFQYRLWPQQLDASTQSFLFGVLDANLVHEQKSKIGGIENLNSGGTTLFISPGIQYAAKTWIGEAAVQIPVYQNLGGTRLEKNYIARASLRFNF